MKIVELSNHVSEQLQSITAQRQASNDAAIIDFKKQIRHRRDARQQAGLSASLAWKDRRILAALGGWLHWALLSLRPRPAAPILMGMTQQEAVLQSGRDGEQRVAQHLAQRLSDDWTWMAGYKNRKGEIDGVLVGPGGVFAVEIKYINGTIYCQGDQWWRDKYDQYGNLVETKDPIADRGGRGPSRQVNEAADELQAFLSQRSGVQRIKRVVIFSHENATIGQVRRATVDCVATLRTPAVAQFFTADGVLLDSKDVDGVIRTIQRDHSFHAKPRPRAPGGDSGLTKGGMPDQRSASRDGRIGEGQAETSSPTQDTKPQVQVAADSTRSGRIEPTLRL